MTAKAKYSVFVLRKQIDSQNKKKDHRIFCCTSVQFVPCNDAYISIGNSLNKNKDGACTTDFNFLPKILFLVDFPSSNPNIENDVEIFSKFSINERKTTSFIVGERKERGKEGLGRSRE